MADTDQTYRVAGEELRQFIEPAERLDAEKADIADRKRDKDDLAEEAAVLDMYKQALGE